ncbi:D-glycero-alpha-D-manno-heptose-1,7-bisphosphate 7-phosphatase [Pseudomonas sp. 210_17 TE3656]
MAKTRALFLDRDGVINHDAGYTSSKENFHFIDGIFDLCRAARQSGYLLIVVTNQAGIGRGYYTEQDFLLLSDWMCKRFEEEGAPITEVFYCPYHPEHGVGHYKMDSVDRKPNPGLLLKASEKYDLDMLGSLMIGDKASDMEAALRSGVGTRCHYRLSDDEESVSDAATHHILSLRDCIALLKDQAAI